VFYGGKPTRWTLIGSHHGILPFSFVVQHVNFELIQNKVRHANPYDNGNLNLQ
jgi:hypothetical protein